MIGRRFNKLVVLSLVRVEQYVSPKGVKANIQYFHCLCDCGNEKVLPQQKLYTTKSCGCLIGQHSKSQREDLTGKTYGRLTVISLQESTGKWMCSCECGEISYSRKSSLQRGDTKSCGCLQREAVSEARISQLKELRKSKGLPEDIPIETQDSLERSKFKPLAAEIIERDNFTCAWCSKIGGKLNAHHIKLWSTHVEIRFDKSNLVTLCEDCHKDVHKGGNTKTDPMMTILLQGYCNSMESAEAYATRLELTPN